MSNRTPEIEGLLGDLEQAVMEVVWASDEVTVRDVHEALAARELAYTTVMTVMSRLAEKEVLSRERQGRAYVYRPVQRGRRGFVRHAVRERMRSLLAQFGDLAVAAFVDELGGADSQQLAALEALVAELDHPPEEEDSRPGPAGVERADEPTDEPTR